MSTADHPEERYLLENASDEENSSSPHIQFESDKGTFATAGVLRTWFNITKCFIGAASLELPWAMLQAGWLAGVIGILILCALSNFTLRILAHCGHLANRRRPTYPELGRQAFGAAGEYAVWFGVIAMTLGVCGSYFVFIGTAAHCILSPYSSFFSAGVCILLVLPIIIMFSFLRNFSFLAPTSVLGIMALLFAVIVSFSDAAADNSFKPLSEYPLFRYETFPLFLGNAAFLYLIHSVVLPTEQAMKDNSKYTVALNYSMVFVTVLNLVYATLTYMLYAEKTQGNVIDNISHGAIKTTVRIFLSVDLLCTCALFLFPMSESLELAMFDRTTFGTFRTEAKRNILRVVLVGAITAIAYLIPDFSTLTGLSGGFGNNLVGFILPPIIYLRLQHQRGYWYEDREDSASGFTKDNKKRAEVGMCVFVVVFGATMMGLSTHSFVQSIISGTDSSSC